MRQGSQRASIVTSCKHPSSQLLAQLQQSTDTLGNTPLLSPFLSCSPLLWKLPKFEEEKRHGLMWRTAISWRFISLRAHGTTISIIYSRNYKAFIFYFMSRTTWYGEGRCYNGFQGDLKTLSKTLYVNTHFPWNTKYTSPTRACIKFTK